MRTRNLAIFIYLQCLNDSATVPPRDPFERRVSYRSSVVAANRIVPVRTNIRADTFPGLAAQSFRASNLFAQICNGQTTNSSKVAFSLEVETGTMGQAQLLGAKSISNYHFENELL